jgi:hypothetical protein
MKNQNEVGKLEGRNINDRVRARDYSTTKFILKTTSIKSIGGMRTASDDTLGPNRRPAARRGPVFIS